MVTFSWFFFSNFDSNLNKSINFRYEPKGYWFDSPSIFMKDGKYQIACDDEQLRSSEEFDSVEQIFDHNLRMKSPTFKKYDTYIKFVLDNEIKKGRHFGALMMEVRFWNFFFFFQI